MFEKLKARLSEVHIFRTGNREIVARGLRVNFWADISHRCLTASWPAFIAGAAAVFIVFNAVFAVLYWIGDQPVSNVSRNDFLDYLYFSIETLSTAGYGDMHPQTHYGHFVATVELFTGIFSMSVMTGLVFARFSRPKARLLFANYPVISNYEGRQTLMIRFANERHNIIGNASARLWFIRNITGEDGQFSRRFFELTLVRSEHPALALTWTLYHIIDSTSPLYGLETEDLQTINAAFVVVVSGYDLVAAQPIHSQVTYDYASVRFGQRYVNILETFDDGRIQIDYSKFHETLDG